MKTVDAHAELMKAHVVEQLEKSGIYDNDYCTYRELLNKLGRARILEVKVGNPGSGWF